jgi:hypothetical protein
MDTTTRRDETPNPLPDMMNPEVFRFLAIMVQMGHDVWYRFRDYWTRTEFFTPFYPNTMTQDHCLHIVHYVHFTYNDNEIDKNVENYDRLWKIKASF